MSPRPEGWPRVKKPDGMEAETGHWSQLLMSLRRVNASQRRQPGLEVIFLVGGML